MGAGKKVATVPEEPEPEEPEEPKENIICENEKWASYTNIDTINILWEYIEVGDIYSENGLIKETSTGATLVAMGTQYELDQYYMITFSNGFEIYVKNIDVKAEEHTDINNCYTTSDNTIVEFWVDNNFLYLSAGISKYTDYGTVVKIEEIK
jgi:hypothetical protein